MTGRLTLVIFTPRPAGPPPNLAAFTWGFSVATTDRYLHARPSESSTAEESAQMDRGAVSVLFSPVHNALIAAPFFLEDEAKFREGG